MDNIDQYIKDKLSAINYEASDANIASMEALLDGQKKKRGAFFWWFLGTMLLVLIVAGAYLFNNFTTEKFSSEFKDEEFALNAEKDEILEQNIQTTSNQNMPTSDIIQQAAIDQGDNSNKRTKVETIKRHDVIAVNQTSGQSKDDIEAIEKAATYSKSNGNDSSVNSNSAAKINTGLGESKIEAPIYSSAKEGIGEIISENNVADQQSSIAHLTIDKIESGISVSLGRTINVFNQDPIDEKIVNRLPNFGLYVAYGPYPKNDFNPDKVPYYLDLGLQYDRPIFKRLLLNASLGYAVRKGGFNFLKQAERKQYGFRLRSSNNNLTVENVHMISSSIGISVVLKKLHFGANLSPKYILGAKGNLVYTESVDDVDQRFEFEDRWVSLTGFNKVPVDLSVFTAYQIHPKFRLQINANYGIRPLFDPLTYEQEESFLYTRSSQLFFVSLKAVYSIN